jgi:two-component system, NtrC family, sensor kinase
MPRGIARKLVIWLTVILVIVEGLFAYSDIQAQKRQLLNEMTLSAELASQTMAATTWNAMLEDRREYAYQMMNNVARQKTIDKVRVFNKAGRITFSTGDDRDQVVDTDAEACSLCHAAGRPLVHVAVPSRTREFRREDGQHVLGMVTPIYNEPSCSTAACHAHPASIHVLGVVDITMPLARVDAQVHDLVVRSALMALLSVLVVAFFVVLFARRFVQQPVRKLIAATHTLGVAGQDQPLEITADDELGELAHSFRGMQERLNASNQQLVEFTETLERRVEERTARLREAERKLIQSDRLASLGQLAASVAHEINNPLSGVINFGRLMQRLTAGDEVPRERMGDFRTYLGHVVTETERCARIVGDLLVFSRRSSTSHEPHDLNELVRRTLSVINHRLELGEVTPQLELAEDLPQVSCDASQVQQIATNLILNAAEAMETGSVTIRTRYDRANGCVVLEVADTGTGIAPEHLPRIYDPFFSTKKEGQGTGLGLAVVYGIVNAHGGQIDVDTAVGRGTTFTVTLPLGGADGTPPAAVGAAGPAC